MILTAVFDGVILEHVDLTVPNTLAHARQRDVAVQFGYYLLFTGLTTLCMYLVQLLTAMLISNQAVGLIVGVVGSFCGLFSLFLQQHVLSKLWLWPYYSQLFLCGMNWDKETRVTEMYWVTPDWGAFLLLLAGFLLTLLAGWRLLERKEW